ncbi:SGNH/GDSL hydrolase family protein [Candidatus Peregrinibacteria bacterium]|nr:SGNH/GDSL hydrolase family protein [Candidatus Peregrinibacteria bacterium]
MADNPEKEKDLSEEPRKEAGIQLAEAIIKYLKLEGLKSSDIVTKDNPWLSQYLDFAEGLKKNNGETDQADLDNLIDIREDRGQSITLIYENTDLNISIKKDEDIYKAIFWQEALAEQELLAKQRHSEGQEIAGKEGQEKRGEEAHKAATRAQEEAQPEAPEHKAGQIHLDYEEAVSKLSAEELKDFREKIAGAEVEDIRYNSKLLRDDKETDPIKSTKQETLRRLSAYTNRKDETNYNEGWYTLNYNQFGVDKKGFSHEMNVGMGDILIDPDIKKVLVQRQGEEAFVATRGIVSSGRHIGRVAFLYPNGQYVSTFTGDRFRILSGEAQTSEIYSKDLETEENARVAHREVYKAEQAADFGQHVEWQNNLGGRVQGPTTDTGIENKLNGLGENGADVIAYCKEICEKLNIPWIIYKELVQRESGWNPGAKWDNSKSVIKSSAAGLGAFLDSAWESFMNKGCGGKVLDDRWGSPKGSPITMEHRMNIYANAYATAWLITKSINAFPGYRDKAPHERAFIYYLAHHEGVAGAKSYLKFINLMQSENHNTKGEIATAYLQNPDKYNQILHKSQAKRIATAGIHNFLNVYFKVAHGVALKVAGNDPELMAAKELPKELPKEAENKETGEKLSYDPRTSIILGASIINGAAKYLPGNPENQAVGGKGIVFIRKQFDQLIAGQPGKYKTLIMDGGTGNGFPNEIVRGGVAITEKNIELTYERITKNFDYMFRKAKELGMNVVVATHSPWGKRLMKMAKNDPKKYQMLVDLQSRVSKWTMEHPLVDRVIPFHQEFANPTNPDMLADEVGGQGEGWHLSPKGYQKMAARIMREFS